MRTQENVTWTNADFLAGYCGVQDIGHPKEVEFQEVQEVLNALPPLNMAEMRQSALRVARGKLGYDKFFEAYPSFHHKFLIAMAKESAPLPQAQTAPPMLEVPWITAQRLSYKRDAEEATQSAARDDPLQLPGATP